MFIGMLCVLARVEVKAQWNIDKVKNMFGSSKEVSSKVSANLEYLASPELAERFPGSMAEEKAATYISEQFKALNFKPYLGQYLQRFTIDKKNNLSQDAHLHIFDHPLAIGAAVVIPPFSGIGKLNTQAMPGMTEPDNLWFIKFSEVGDQLNSRFGTGLDKMYQRAKQAIEQGASAVMFLNDVNAENDFTNSFQEGYQTLSKPVFILNHEAYKKHIVQEGKGKHWIPVSFDIAKTRRTMEGHNVIAYWQNQSDQTIVIGTHFDKQPGSLANDAGVAALLEVASRIQADRLRKYNYLLVAFSGTADERKGAETLITHMGLNDKKVNCMINLGDVGASLSSNQLFISGLASSATWPKVLGTLERNFNLQQLPYGKFGEDNHCSFYEKNIPVLNVFTKRAVTDKKNHVTTIDLVAQAVADLLLALDNAAKLPFSPTSELPDLRKIKLEASIGLAPDIAYAGEGVLIGEVFANSAAAFSNLQTGDVIIKMGDYDIRDLNDYVRELKKYKTGDKVMMKILRVEQKKEMFITFK